MKHCGIFLILLCSFAALAQEKKFSGQLNQEPFARFAELFAQQTGQQVFYHPDDCDSLLVTLEAQDMEASEVFRRVLANSSFSFVIDSFGNVFVVKDRILEAHLHPGFFEGERTQDLPDAAVLPAPVTQKPANGKKVVEIGSRDSRSQKSQHKVAGYIKDRATGDVITGVVIGVAGFQSGGVSDAYGYFFLSLPRGQHRLVARGVGLKEVVQDIVVYGDGELTIEMEEDVTFLKEVVVESGKDLNVSGMQMGFSKLDTKSLKKVTTAMGEVDILRAVLTLPGVQSVGEASTGLNVRGGSANQNLILFNDAVVYNPAHLFGFFTAFNPDVVKSVEILKSGIPAERGGRLSSVIDIAARDGNKKKFAGSGGIGPLTGKLTLEGPIIKDKASFLVGGRSMYSDWLLRKIPNETLKNSSATFYDINAGVTYDLDSRNIITVGFYASRDNFRLIEDTTYRYRNTLASIRWRRSIDADLFFIVNAAYSGYQYEIESSDDPANAFRLKHRVNQGEVKADFTYTGWTRHALNAGANVTYYQILPGELRPIGKNSLILFDQIQKERALENAFYVGDTYDLNSRVTVYGGLRYSMFTSLGPGFVRKYAPGFSKSEDTVIDTLVAKSGQPIAFYHGPELRIAVKFMVDPTLSIKASYNRMRQYVQMLSNTTSAAPTDIWKLSDPHIKPQIGDQLSLGLYKNLKGGAVETSVEGYYKTMKNFLDYKDGADLIMNHQVETDVLMAHGAAYGVELMVKKANGRLNGWVSYTYSRSLLQTRSSFASEFVNQGRYYPSNYDKPHAANLVGNYRLSHRVSISWNTTYSTGRPITLPLAKYEVQDAVRLLYSERNKYRVDDYFRMDFSVSLEGNHKIKKLAHSSWTIGVYNITGRKNVYSAYFRSEGGIVRGYKMSVFGTAIPSITYNFRF